MQPIEKEHEERYIMYLKQQSVSVFISPADRSFYRKALKDYLAVKKNAHTKCNH